MPTFFHGSRRFRLRAWHQSAGPGHDVSWLAPSILRDALRDPSFARRAAELVSHPQDESPLATLLGAIERGLLVLEEEARTTISMIPIAREESDDAPAPEARELDWIEVEIVDGQGHPVPYVMVEVELPNGRTRRQMANENGWLRLDGIPGGNCTVRLPRWDRASWRPA